MRTGFVRPCRLAQQEISALKAVLPVLQSDAARAVYLRAIGHLEHFMVAEREYEPKTVKKNNREDYGLKPIRRKA